MKQQSSTQSGKKSSSRAQRYLWSSVLPLLPSSPGVYWFLDENDEVLYVGKAKNLKNRVSSYAAISHDHPKTNRLVRTAVKLKFKELESELEALLTEAQLIKTYQPPFNIDLKDDKSPLYIVITSDTFPRILTARKKQLVTQYSDVPARNIFGPFSSAYMARRVIRLARSVFKFCNATPQEKSAHAACFYTHIGLCGGACKGNVSISDYTEVIKNVRIFLNGKRKNLLRTIKEEMKIASDLQEHEKAARLRDQIILLEKYYKALNPISFDPDIPILQDDVHTYRLKRLSKLLHMYGVVPSNYQIKRIEGYDISNTSGELSVASMVVFEGGLPAKDQYRMFRIKHVKGPNDPKMLQEALARRMNHPEWQYPDLIIMDGGRTQLKAAQEIIQGKIPTISLVKRPDRLLFRDTDGNFTSFTLIEGKPISMLAQYVRDESHRFAKNYHKKLRRKNMIK